MARLSGTGLLADDLYLMAHDDVSGKPFLQPRAIAVGLAGGLLAEQMLAEKIAIWQGSVVMADSAPPRDELGQIVVGHVLTERQWHRVRDFLARTATGDVAARLER